ncbi:uncharacterized protein [Euphorbia lathyris]
MVFINDVAFEIGGGPFNVREAFGDENMLIHSSGHPVFTNKWELTQETTSSMNEDSESSTKEETPSAQEPTLPIFQKIINLRKQIQSCEKNPVTRMHGIGGGAERLLEAGLLRITIPLNRKFSGCL